MDKIYYVYITKVMLGHKELFMVTIIYYCYI